MQNIKPREKKIISNLGHVLPKRTSHSAVSHQVDRITLQFGQYLTTKRKSLGLSHYQLAEKANVPEIVILRLEAGRIRPQEIKRTYLVRLAEVLDADVDFFAIMLERTLRPISVDDWYYYIQEWLWFTIAAIQKAWTTFYSGYRAKQYASLRFITVFQIALVLCMFLSITPGHDLAMMQYDSQNQLNGDSRRHMLHDSLNFLGPDNYSLSPKHRNAIIAGLGGNDSISLNGEQGLNKSLNGVVDSHRSQSGSEIEMSSLWCTIPSGIQDLSKFEGTDLPQWTPISPHPDIVVDSEPQNLSTGTIELREPTLNDKVDKTSLWLKDYMTSNDAGDKWILTLPLDMQWTRGEELETENSTMPWEYVLSERSVQTNLLIESIRQTDIHTFEFNLEEPNLYFPMDLSDKMSSYGINILSGHFEQGSVLPLKNAKIGSLETKLGTTSWEISNTFHNGEVTDAFVERLDENGVRQWNTFLDDSGNAHGHSSTTVEKDSLFFIGLRDPSWETPVNYFSRGQHLFAVKLNYLETRRLLDFNDCQLSSQIESQDTAPTVSILNNGYTLQINGNSWEKCLIPYTVTPNTILEFDFRSDSEGKIHAIGLDTESLLSPERAFKLYGTQDWGHPDFDTYVSPDWQHYAISVGQFFTGNMLHFAFVNDHDMDIPAVNSLFANVFVYEEGL